MSALVAVDLFAGGGGLTVGLKRAGFRVAAAVEIDPRAYSTYTANHPEVTAFKQDIRTVLGSSISGLSNAGGLHLISGCPPCQGFTSLTSKYRRDDPRNALISEMGRLVEETKPTAVMMENVPGLLMRGKRRFNTFVRRLEALGYVVTYGVLQVADYGVPQFRRRLVLLAGLGFEIPLPLPTHAKGGTKKLPSWRTVRDAISGMPKPKTLEAAKKVGPPQETDWHIVRTLSVENRRRIKAVRPGKNWWSLPAELRPNCHKGEYRGFGNVYGRMKWGETSPTITGGCTTLSKGRFGHPSAHRTISVREAALLQTFPKDYLIDTPHMDAACNIIGNALPCDFAEALARQCATHIKRHLEASAKRVPRKRKKH
jgi:DNA (cytosine-5)-methyltransferase 1